MSIESIKPMMINNMYSMIVVFSILKRCFKTISKYSASSELRAMANGKVWTSQLPEKNKERLLLDFTKHLELVFNTDKNNLRRKRLQEYLLNGTWFSFLNVLGVMKNSFDPKWDAFYRDNYKELPERVTEFYSLLPRIDRDFWKYIFVLNTEIEGEDDFHKYMPVEKHSVAVINFFSHLFPEYDHAVQKHSEYCESVYPVNDEDVIVDFFCTAFIHSNFHNNVWKRDYSHLNRMCITGGFLTQDNFNFFGQNYLHLRPEELFADKSDRERKTLPDYKSSLKVFLEIFWSKRDKQVEQTFLSEEEKRACLSDLCSFVTQVQNEHFWFDFLSLEDTDLSFGEKYCFGFRWDFVKDLILKSRKDDFDFPELSKINRPKTALISLNLLQEIQSPSIDLSDLKSMFVQALDLEKPVRALKEKKSGSKQRVVDVIDFEETLSESKLQTFEVNFSGCDFSKLIFSLSEFVLLDDLVKLREKAAFLLKLWATMTNFNKQHFMQFFRNVSDKMRFEDVLWTFYVKDFSLRNLLTSLISYLYMFTDHKVHPVHSVFHLPFQDPSFMPIDTKSLKSKITTGEIGKKVQETTSLLSLFETKIERAEWWKHVVNVGLLYQLQWDVLLLQVFWSI